MSKKILIEATHAEETRVAVVEGSTLVDFDHEHAEKRTIKGNIYLAKIVRVEPSLQAAFVDYGGNRHGFLAFDEIHPDYFRIPVEDRKILEELRREELKKQQELELVEDAEEDEDSSEKQEDDVSSEKGESSEEEQEAPVEETKKKPSSVAAFIRRYKIQEVIKSRQIVLVQAVKEERGNKGAAMTTYVSLAGRYCVLMPNTSTSGGVSRRINKVADRKRLKKILTSFEVPEGMSLIIRTAGMDRNKTELKRDYKYLLTLWAEIREQTLSAVAPSLVYTEADLIQRTIRDMYTRDVEEVFVEGEEAYKHAKNVMRKVLPSHSKRVQKYAETDCPLFFKYGIEKQINQIFQSQVPLKSGGYLVIHQTEALVSIDVNSGRATKERHIDSTAFKTNLEAATETGRQLKLRDLAGLVVIDFIDMPEYKQNQAVEKALRDSMSDDRARVQIGRISQFGLLELSRQRMRPSLHERSGIPCVNCLGTGYVRSPESIALQILRLAEEECVLNKRQALTVILSSEVGFFILNHKKKCLQDIETKIGASITLEASAEVGNGFIIQTPEGEVVFSTDAEKYENASGSNGKEKSGGRSDQGGRNKFKRSKEDQDKKKDDRRKNQPSEKSTDSEKENQDPENTSEKKHGRKRSRRRNRSGKPMSDDKKEDHQKTPQPEESVSETEKPKIKTKEPSSAPKQESAEKNEKSPVQEKPKKRGSSKKGWWQKLLDPEE